MSVKRMYREDEVRLQQEMRTAKPEDRLHYCQHKEQRGRHEVECGLPIPAGETMCGWHRRTIPAALRKAEGG